MGFPIGIKEVVGNIFAVSCGMVNMYMIKYGESQKIHHV